jgi:hypothetical protein
MRKLRIFLFLFFIIQFLSIESHGQDTIKEEIRYKNNITLHVGRFVLNEVRFGYERQLTGRHTLRAILGFQYPTDPESFNSIPVIFPFFTYPPDYYKVSKGIYIGTGYNYTLGTRSRIYASAEVYFSYNYYDKKYFHLCVGSDTDSYVSLESMRLKKTGLKILFGKKVRIKSWNKIGIELDFFIGFGIQYRLEELTIFEKKNGSCHWDYSELYKKDPPENETYRNWNPTVNAGILIGVPFKQK